MTTERSPFDIDSRQIRRSFSQAAPNYDAVAAIQTEVRQRLLERLDWMRIAPSCVLDVGSGTGHGSTSLAQRYDKATVLSLDIALGMLQQARSRISWWQRWRSKQHLICADATALPLATNSTDLIFSNLTLQWCHDLDRVFGDFRRVLRPNGLVMFSTFGPDTLKELRAAWRTVDNYNHVNAFMDMHDIGDGLVRAGFADPVMDVEHITLTYPEPMKLMRELKLIGAHNVTAGRNRGLTGRHALKKVIDAYEQFRRDGALPCTYEVVYGHAWIPNETKSRATNGEVRISLQQLRGKKL